jgi:Pyridoxamine 5'-phosphate oxidase
VWIDERGSEVLELPDCQRLLAVAAKAHRFGHLGISQSDAPLVLPVDFAVHGPDVLIRVGENLFGRILGRLVAFEVDGTESGLGQENHGSARSWSVLVRGLAIEEDDSLIGGHLPAPRVAEPGQPADPHTS